MNIETFDVHSASDTDLRQRYDFGCRMDAEMDPETPPVPYDAWLKHMRTKSEFADTPRWIARDGDAIVGSGFVRLSRTPDNLHLCRGGLDVAPEYRRRGLGAMLLGAIVDTAEADGRSVLGLGTVQGHDSEHFLKAMGFEQKLLDRRSRLHVDQIPEGLLDAWMADATVKAPGYSLVFIGEKTPEEYRERFIDVLNTMNDAPREGLDLDDSFVTLAQLDDWERQAAETGSRESFFVAVHDETGEFAGFTGIDWEPSHPEVIWQGGTAVKAAHRGHGIGRWLKAANLLHVIAENGEARFVDTWNAGSNQWMLAINDELGFAPYIWYTAWQAPTADIKAALATK